MEASGGPEHRAVAIGAHLGRRRQLTFRKKRALRLEPIDGQPTWMIAEIPLAVLTAALSFPRLTFPVRAVQAVNGARQVWAGQGDALHARRPEALRGRRKHIRAAMPAPVLGCDDRPGAGRSHRQGWIAGKLASLEPKCPVGLIVSVPVVLAFDVARGALVLPGWNGVGTPGERSGKHQRGGP